MVTLPEEQIPSFLEGAMLLSAWYMPSDPSHNPSHHQCLTTKLFSGVTTYAENIGVMAVTRIYSTLIFIIAAVVAILLGFSPKFGALIATIPQRSFS